MFSAHARTPAVFGRVYIYIYVGLLKMNEVIVISENY